jgi:hypothetical protein
LQAHALEINKRLEMDFLEDTGGEGLSGTAYFCSVLLLIMTTLSASETASSAFERGKKEEASQNYEEAYARVQDGVYPAAIEH